MWDLERDSFLFNENCIYIEQANMALFGWQGNPLSKGKQSSSDIILSYVPKSFSIDNLRDLCDTLISCENEAKLESGNEVMKQMDEYHYVNLLSDVILGNLIHSFIFS